MRQCDRGFDARTTLLSSNRQKTFMRALSNDSKVLTRLTLTDVEALGSWHWQPDGGGAADPAANSDGRPQNEGSRVEKHLMHSFCTQFAEVRVDPALDLVRVTRLVGSLRCRSYPEGKNGVEPDDGVHDLGT